VSGGDGTPLPHLEPRRRCPLHSSQGVLLSAVPPADISADTAHIVCEAQLPRAAHRAPSVLLAKPSSPHDYHPFIPQMPP
jgi:hypothetical protein